MEEKKIIYQIILDIWDLTKKYVFQPLNDDGWEQLSNEANVISNKYREYGDSIRLLFSDLYFAVEKYKAARDKEKNGNY